MTQGGCRIIRGEPEDENRPLACHQPFLRPMAEKTLNTSPRP